MPDCSSAFYIIYIHTYSTAVNRTRYSTKTGRPSKITNELCERIDHAYTGNPELSAAEAQNIVLPTSKFVIIKNEGIVFAWVKASFKNFALKFRIGSRTSEGALKNKLNRPVTDLEVSRIN